MQTKLRSQRWLIAAALSLFALCLTAQDLPTVGAVPPAPAGPIAKMEFKEFTYDFGTVEEGTRVSRVFTFTNTSDKPLVLSDAKGSCGCTVPQWPREPIMPGETASLTVEFNSTGKRGMRNQKVTITANTSPPQTFLSLTGEVKSREGSDPSVITVGEETETKVSPDCFAIYPNPTAEILNLKMEERSFGQPAIISIFSQNGQLMARRKVETIEGNIEFSVSHYPAGSYIANVQVGDGKPESRCFVVME